MQVEFHQTSSKVHKHAQMCIRKITQNLYKDQESITQPFKDTLWYGLTNPPKYYLFIGMYF